MTAPPSAAVLRAEVTDRPLDAQEHAALVADRAGSVSAYAMFGLQERGSKLVETRVMVTTVTPMVTDPPAAARAGAARAQLRGFENRDRGRCLRAP